MIVLLFSYPSLFLSPRPVLPSLLACSSIPVLWDLARERLSSYIEKSSGREKNWRYLYHPLCSPTLSFLAREAYRAEKPVYLTNGSRFGSANAVLRKFTLNRNCFSSRYFPHALIAPRFTVVQSAIGSSTYGLV